MTHYYIHPQKIPVVKAYEKVGHAYERTIHDRVWDIWLSLVTADPVKEQEVKKVVPQVYRTKDPADGKGVALLQCGLVCAGLKGQPQRLFVLGRSS
jgi:hypothetical protein